MPQSAAKLLLFNTTGESTWGTTGAATAKLHGLKEASIKVESKVETVPSVGWYGPSPVAEEVSQFGTVKLAGVVTFEEITRLLNGFFTPTSGSTGNSTGGTTAPYYYSYTAPVTSTQAVYTYTLEHGTSGACYRAPGTVFNKFSLKAEAEGLWEFGIDGFCKQVIPATTGFTTAGNVDRTVNAVRMADTSLYIDAFSTGTMGATAVTGTLISFTLDVDMKRHTKFFAGSLNPQNWGDARYEGSLKFTAEFTASAKALVDELLTASTGAAVSRQIRIKASEGSSATLKTLAIDFAGIKAEGEELFSDREGNVTVDFTFNGRYSTALSNWLQMIVENGSSSTT